MEESGFLERIHCLCNELQTHKLQAVEVEILWLRLMPVEFRYK